MSSTPIYDQLVAEHGDPYDGAWTEIATMQTGVIARVRHTPHGAVIEREWQKAMTVNPASHPENEGQELPWVP